jgi:hypothetical protein
MRGGARPPARTVDTAPPASTNSPPPLTMVFLAMSPDLLCMGLFCKKQFHVPPPAGGQDLLRRCRRLLADVESLTVRAGALNTTGVTNSYPSIGGKWLQLLKEATPQIERVAIIYNVRVNQDDGGYAIFRR